MEIFEYFMNENLLFHCINRCNGKTYPSHLPDTSIVIVFHNEAWSTLLRTVHSIIRTAPRALLKEILLVDDASERDFLGKQLEDYVATLQVPVKVLRTGKRSGLIRARLIGAEESTGQVITFLDAHCEVRWRIFWRSFWRSLSSNRVTDSLPVHFIVHRTLVGTTSE